MQPRPDALAAVGNAPPAPGGSSSGNPPPESGARGGERPADIGNLSRIVNPVQMDVIEGLDVLVLRGSAQDVEQMTEVVRQIERLSAETEPAIDVLMMKHIECQAMAALVKGLYDDVYMARQGTVNITPLVTPNAILIVGRKENVKTVQDIVARLDQPAVPGAQFQVFHLHYASAGAAQTTILNAFAGTAD
jgi:type II secretory pathway component GspD/PulD (secretin)